MLGEVFPGIFDFREILMHPRSNEWTIYERLYLDSIKTPLNISGYFSQRLSGFIVPPSTSLYTLSISSDGGSQLHLSTDASSDNMRLIAYSNSSTSNKYGYKTLSMKLGSAM